MVDVNVIATQGDVVDSSIDIWRITPQQVALVLGPEAQVDLTDPDALIALYEATFRHVGPDEYWSIRSGQERWLREPGEPTREDWQRKYDIWHVRWSVPVRLAELLVARRAAGQDIGRYLSWMHRQLTCSWLSLPLPDEYRPHGILERIADWGIQRLLGAIPPALNRYLDGEVLGEFLFAMDYFDLFDERTWRVPLPNGREPAQRGVHPPRTAVREAVPDVPSARAGAGAP